MKRILTYGTYDLLHYGHIRLLKRAKAMGDYLVVAISTDEFNALKGKKAYHNYETRKEMLEAVRYVDLVIPETDWEQNACATIARWCTSIAPRAFPRLRSKRSLTFRRKSCSSPKDAALRSRFCKREP